MRHITDIIMYIMLNISIAPVRYESSSHIGTKHSSLEHHINLDNIYKKSFYMVGRIYRTIQIC